MSHLSQLQKRQLLESPLQREEHFKKATKRTYVIGDLNDASSQINNVLAPLGMRTFGAARLEGMASRYSYDPFLNEVLDQFAGKIGDLGANISPQKQNEIVDLIIELAKED